MRFPPRPLISLNAAVRADRKKVNVNAEPPKEGADRSTRVAKALAGASAILSGAPTRVSNLGNQHDPISTVRRLCQFAQIGPCCTFSYGGCVGDDAAEIHALYQRL